jgi:hypothetical protein
MDYSYSSSTDLDPGMFFVIFGIIAAVTVIMYVIFSYFLGKVFKKAGEDAWKAWVPVYNNWVFLELGGQKGWLSLLTLAAIIPFVGWIGSLVAYVFMAIAAYRIGMNLQKEGVFVLLYILLTPVWIIWLAVDKSVWQAPGVAPSNSGAAPAYQPPAPQQPQAPVAPTPQDTSPNQNNTPPTPPIAS